MDRQLYSIIDDNGNHIAYHMELRHALILVQGLMLEYYNEPRLTYRIMREQTDCEDVSEERREEVNGFKSVGQAWNTSQE